MKNRKLRVGIVGAGGMARGPHIPGWKKISEVEVVAVADINLEAAKSVATQHSIPDAVSDLQSLLKFELDVIDICTPNMAHTEAALAGLNAGLHVLCEKPLAVTTRDVLQIGTLADKKKLKFMTAQFQRYHAPSQAIKGWANAGGLGHQSENEDLSFQLFGMDGGVKWPSAEYATVVGKTFAQGTLTNPRNVASAYDEEIKTFHDCIVNDKPSPVPWTETIKVIAILEAIYESQEQGREVTIKI